MMIEVADLPTGRQADAKFSRPLGIFAEWRLQVYGYAVAAIYAAFLVSVYRAGTWIVTGGWLPIYTDFACAWAAAVQALHGDAASLYDPSEFVKVQAALVGPRDYFYPNWPYPPTFLLILAPFAALPYLGAFITWDLATLLGLIVVVYFIVRRRPAIALVLASPFTAWNFLAAQNGFLTGSLLGAGLLFLESRPVLAGVFIGLLTYKPQFGILLPVALAASGRWRTFASAAVVAALFTVASIATFGTGVWAAFPRQLVAQSSVNFFGDPDGDWGYLQTVYGLIRSLHGSARLAWLAQGLTALMSAVIVWIVWRSQTRYALKAATLSAAALIATPYAFAYDMAAIVIPAAFLATDQLRRGLLRGDQTIWIVLFGAPLIVLIILGDSVGGPTFGGTPVSLLTVIALFGVILRRARHPIAAT
jgi:arabinofuranan 3-O-arabinosyltransferase